MNNNYNKFKINKSYNKNKINNKQLKTKKKNQNGLNQKYLNKPKIIMNNKILKIHLEKFK